MNKELIQGTTEWHELRSKMIGASDAPIIMEISPWKTPYQLWEQKVLRGYDQEQTQAMKRGNDLEPLARAEFEKMTGILVFPEVRIHPTIAYMMASLDGIDFEGKQAVEIKCPNKIDHEMAMDGVIPEKYIPQLQHQMEVCNLQIIFYFSFNGTTGKVLTLEKDAAYISNMIEKEAEFYKCMIHLEPPKYIQKDFIERGDEEWNTVASEWLSVSNSLQQLEKQQEQLRSRLIDLAGSSNTMGSGVRLSKVIRKGNIEYQKIPQINGIDLEPYRKQSSTSWRIAKA